MNEKHARQVLDTSSTVTPAELYDIIRLQYDAMMRDPDDPKAKNAIIVHGSPGCGKSSVVQQFCRDRGINIVDVRLAQIEPMDIKGMPVPDHDKHVMKWYVNGQWPSDENDTGIIFLDEFTSADRASQGASYQLVLDRKLGDIYKVPKKYMIVAAGNNTTDRAIATVMSSALANRFTHVELRDDANVWINWARDNDVHPAVIGFIMWHPELLFSMEGQRLDRGWPSPRSWVTVSNHCRIYESEPKLMSKMVYGAVGVGVGVDFMQFYETSRKFKDILVMMTDPNSEIEIPSDPGECNAICSAVVYQLWRGADAADTARRVAGFYRVLEKLSADWGAKLITSAYKTNDPATTARRCRMLREFTAADGTKPYYKWKDAQKGRINGAKNINFGNVFTEFENE